MLGANSRATSIGCSRSKRVCVHARSACEGARESPESRCEVDRPLFAHRRRPHGRRRAEASGHSCGPHRRCLCAPVLRRCLPLSRRGLHPRGAMQPRGTGSGTGCDWIFEGGRPLHPRNQPLLRRVPPRTTRNRRGLPDSARLEAEARCSRTRAFGLRLLPRSPGCFLPLERSPSTVGRRRNRQAKSNRFRSCSCLELEGRSSSRLRDIPRRTSPPSQFEPTARAEQASIGKTVGPLRSIAGAGPSHGVHFSATRPIPATRGAEPSAALMRACRRFLARIAARAHAVLRRRTAASRLGLAPQARRTLLRPRE